MSLKGKRATIILTSGSKLGKKVTITTERLGDFSKDLGGVVSVTFDEDPKKRSFYWYVDHLEIILEPEQLSLFD